MYAAGNLFGKAKFISFWSHFKVNIFMILHNKVWYLLLCFWSYFKVHWWREHDDLVLVEHDMKKRIWLFLLG